MSQDSSLNGTYCIKNAPHQRGDLWVRVQNGKVFILEPAGHWWRHKVFTVREFREILTNPVNNQ